MELGLARVEETARALQDAALEIEPEDLREAVQRRAATNVFALKPHFMKIDLYISKSEPFALSVMSRRIRMPLLSGREVWISSPEDTILQKLRWYRAGGEAMDQQWRDVVGVLRGADALDRGYLERWSADLGVDDLLADAWATARS